MSEENVKKSLTTARKCDMMIVYGDANLGFKRFFVVKSLHNHIMIADEGPQRRQQKALAEIGVSTNALATTVAADLCILNTL